MASTSQKADEPITEINLTPLVDVCLVLVIIFMAVAPMALTAGISVLHSRAKAAEGKTALTENVQVKLALNGGITINGAAVLPENILQKMSEALERSKDKMVMVSADVGNHVGQVVGILDMAKQCGAAKVAILKSETAAPVEKG